MEILQTIVWESHKYLSAPEFKVAYFLLDLEKGSSLS